MDGEIPRHPRLTTDISLLSHHLPSRTANSTPISSPGLFSPSHSRSNMAFPNHSASEASTPAAAMSSPYLHPLQTRKVRETHKALVDLDLMTGRKIINQYEVIEEIGRGMHGKVKLARNLENGQHVAIKIVPRFSKKRRLGKVTALSPQDKTKKEIAILKKIRHPNVVALLEIIDDPELKKIYMVLEHVELGEVVWRKKGLPNICAVERMRIEKEMRGESLTEEEDRYLQILERKHVIKEIKRQRMEEKRGGPDPWSVEHGAADDEAISRSLATDDEGGFSLAGFNSSPPREGTPVPPADSTSRASTPLPSEPDISSVTGDTGSEVDTPGLLHSIHGSSVALEGTMYGAYTEDPALRGRSPSMADSIISHMSSVDFNPQPHDPYADDYSYVPCFTLDQARSTFRDTVLGLEYLHYEGIVHRDIKPANLLWTKDHRVKISDFGVSYFGRPMRDGEPDEFVSESEARDFDNDLELAKTVGTPAFFAPELCYTDIDEEQPKISEQIDVWSLGVTLYCLIYGRIPFMAEDEFQMFRKIAKGEVYIPEKRLAPVDPQNYPSGISLYKRVNSAPYRDDKDLTYEEVPLELRQLMAGMLETNPEKRMRLREVKRDHWVLEGISNPIAWIDDTDPSRHTEGKKIEVDEREMSSAVIPLTLLERARSAMKRAVGKVIHRTEKVESQSRRRAASSAGSSAGDLPVSGSSTPHPRDVRKKSIRPGEECFQQLKDGPVPSEHPLAQSVTASPQGSPGDNDNQDSVSVGGDINRPASGYISDLNSHPDLTDRPSSRTSTSPGKPPQQHHSRTRSITNAILHLTPALQEPLATTASPATEDAPIEDPIAAIRKSRDVMPMDESSRSRSVDRGLFASTDKRAEPKVSLSTIVAPGSMGELPKRPTPLRSCDQPATNEDESMTSTMFFSSPAIRGYQHGQPRSDPNFMERQYSVPDIDQRPLTAHRVQQMEGKTPPPRVYNSSTPESFARAHEQMMRRKQHENADQEKRRQLVSSRREVDPVYVPCPPSPDDELEMGRPLPPPRRDTTGTVITSASTYAGNFMTPLTSPSEVTSPVSGANLAGKRGNSETFQSNPSLPALLSSASSVSADIEGDMLGRPGCVDRSSLIETTDSLTPPACTKEPALGYPLQDLVQVEHPSTMSLLDHSSNNLAPSPIFSSRAVDDDDDSDSDEGLVMATKTKGRRFSRVQIGQQPERIIASPKRRDTQTSIGSTETAKKVVMSSR